MPRRNGRGERTGDVIVLALIGIAVVVMYWPAVLLRATFFVQDMMVQNYPFRHLASQALLAGELPLWRPEINCGFPLLAEGQIGLFYPLNFLSYRILSTPAGINLSILLHGWLAGAGTYLFLRALGCHRAAGMTAGLAYGCGGFLVIRAMSPNFLSVCAWLPWLFLVIELALQHRRQSLVLVAGAITGLQCLAGHPQAVVYGLLAALAYALWRSLTSGAGRWWTLGLLVGIPVSAALLAAVQLLPTAELVRLSARGEGLDWDSFVSMSLPPERLVTLLLPNAFGNSADGTYWGSEAGFFIQLSAYAGVIPLLLALLAVRRSQAAAREFFALLAGAGMLLALGQYTAVFGVLYRVPGLSFFRIPTRFLLWFAFAVSVLSGLGLHELLTRGSDTVLRRCWWWLIAGLVVVIIGMAWLNRDLLFAGTALHRPVLPTVLLDYAQQLRRDLLRAVVLLLAGGWMVSSQAARNRVLLAVAVPLFIFADLLSFGYGFNGLLDTDVYRQMPESAQVIHQHAGVDRVPAPRIMSLVSQRNTDLDWHGGWRQDTRSYRFYPSTLRMYTGGLYGLHNTLPGWSPLHVRRYWDFMRPQYGLGLAQLAGVEYVVRPESDPRPGEMRIGDTWPLVFQQSDPLPRAYLVGDYVVLQEARARLRHLTGQGFRSRWQVVLEEHPLFFSGNGAGTVRIIAHTPHRVELELQDCGGGLVVLSDTYYPGWRAWVDGQPAGILRANHVFRAVSVPPAATSLIFAYQPASFRLGAWISLAALLAWLVGTVALWRVSRNSTFTVAPSRPLGLGPWGMQVLLVLLLHGIVTRWPLWSGWLERCQALRVWGG